MLTVIRLFTGNRNEILGGYQAEDHNAVRDKIGNYRPVIMQIRVAVLGLIGLCMFLCH